MRGEIPFRENLQLEDKHLAYYMVGGLHWKIRARELYARSFRAVMTWRRRSPVSEVALSLRGDVAFSEDRLIIPFPQRAPFAGAHLCLSATINICELAHATLLIIQVEQVEQCRDVIDPHTWLEWKINPNHSLTAHDHPSLFHRNAFLYTPPSATGLMRNRTEKNKRRRFEDGELKSIS
jgi:hypothetical protein